MKFKTFIILFIYIYMNMQTKDGTKILRYFLFYILYKLTHIELKFYCDNNNSIIKIVFLTK